jgi:hypothetical protein
MRNGARNRNGKNKASAEEPMRVEQGSGNVFADLDFVVDLHGGRLIGNPEHGGEHVMEVY